MAFVIADRVRESSTTTGTGNFTLGGAVTGYQSFDSVLDTGDTTYYTIADQGGANWEVGIGTFTSPSTLARTTILSSSNGGSVVTFTAGTKDVFISLPASKTNTNDQPNVISVNSTSDAVRITQTGTGNALVVEDSANPDATPFVVDANGNVVIGTSTPSTTAYPFYVEGAAGALFSAGTNTAATSPTVGVSRRRTGLASVISGDSLGRFSGFGWDGASFVEASRIETAVDGTPGTNDMPGRLVFSTTGDGASSPTERMRIDNLGRVGINSTALTGYQVRIAGTYASTDVNPIWMGINGTIPSTATGQAYGFFSGSATQAAAFTLTGLNHFFASQGGVGAGSALTNQYGFRANSNLTGATNNYGFFSDIASGTGRWNFYANGTADNYFAGQVQLGAGTAAAPALSAFGDTNTGIFFPLADTIAFAEGGAEAMRIDSGGRLLVGTTTNVAATTEIQVAQTANSVTAPVIDFTKERAGTTVIDGQSLGTIRFWGYDGTAYRQAASILAYVEGTPGLNVMPSVLQLRVRTATGTGDLPRLECLPWGGVTVGHQPGSGPALSGTVPAKLRIAEDTYTDTASAASATITTGTINSIQATAVAATNTGVTYTNLSTLYIQNAPAASTNVTITNPWALYVAAGASYFGGQLRTAAGTAAAPAISTIGDTNTGMFFPAADTIAFAEGGAEAMRIDSSGNVGIGTTTIGSKLTVNGAVAGTFFVNPTTVSANYTIPTNYNAMTAGPITVNSGVTVTVPSGSTWVVA